jgi:hypothetical protein
VTGAGPGRAGRIAGPTSDDVGFGGNWVGLAIGGISGMVDYIVAAVLFVAMITTLVFLWKREH